MDFHAFVTMCCINKVQSRLNAGKKRWNPETLLSWSRTPLDKEKVEHFWVTEPIWPLKFENVEKGMKTRVVDGNVVEWEFSSDTAHLWSSILARLLISINEKITEYNNIPSELRKRPLEHEETRYLVKAITTFHTSLFIFMSNYNRVVKALLGMWSLSSWLQPASE